MSIKKHRKVILPNLGEFVAVIGWMARLFSYLTTTRNWIEWRPRVSVGLSFSGSLSWQKMFNKTTAQTNQSFSTEKECLFKDWFRGQDVVPKGKEFEVRASLSKLDNSRYDIFITLIRP